MIIFKQFVSAKDYHKNKEQKFVGTYCTIFMPEINSQFIKERVWGKKLYRLFIATDNS